MGAKRNIALAFNRAVVICALVVLVAGLAVVLLTLWRIHAGAAIALAIYLSLSAGFVWSDSVMRGGDSHE